MKWVSSLPQVYEAGGLASHCKIAHRSAWNMLSSVRAKVAKAWSIETSRLASGPIIGSCDCTATSKAPAHAVMARFCGSNLGSKNPGQPSKLLVIGAPQCETSLGASPMTRKSLGHRLLEFPHDLRGYGLEAHGWYSPLW